MKVHSINIFQEKYKKHFKYVSRKYLKPFGKHFDSLFLVNRFYVIDPFVTNDYLFLSIKKDE